MNQIVPVHGNGIEYRQSTDAAGLCREIVVKTAKNIQGRKYVCVEGWQAIAIAHGCTASADHVERVTDEGMSGFKAIGIVRRMSDGAEIARAEGFLGDDEGMWAKRPVYARRAMVQTRAISRACRSAFAHVVVMIDAGLSTTPAEEVPDGGFEEAEYTPAPPQQERQQRTNWGGKYPNKTKLHNALREFERELRGCGDSDMLEAFLASEDWQEFYNTAAEHAPHYLTGGNPAPPEFVGLNTLIKQMRDEFSLSDFIPDRNPIAAG